MDVRAVINATNVYQTKGVCDKAARNEKFQKEVASALYKFMEGDWGEVCTEDSVANDEALLRFERVIGSYNTSEGEIWIIAESEDGKKYTTITVLFPNEY